MLHSLSRRSTNGMLPPELLWSRVLEDSLPPLRTRRYAAIEKTPCCRASLPADPFCGKNSWNCSSVTSSQRAPIPDELLQSQTSGLGPSQINSRDGHRGDGRLRYRELLPDAVSRLAYPAYISSHVLAI